VATAICLLEHAHDHTATPQQVVIVALAPGHKGCVHIQHEQVDLAPLLAIQARYSAEALLPSLQAAQPQK
jgi:hypothetical protein